MRMDQTAAPAPASPTLNAKVSASLKRDGAWQTYQRLLETQKGAPGNLTIRGTIEIVRCTIVRDFLAKANRLKVTPRLTPEFLSDFDRFDLNVHEGYLVSLIDARSNLESLLKLSPFDSFTTLFTFSVLELKGAIALPS